MTLVQILKVICKEEIVLFVAPKVQCGRILFMATEGSEDSRKSHFIGAKKKKNRQSMTALVYCACSYLEYRIWPPWALINVEQPSRFRNKVNCEEVVDTLLSKIGVLSRLFAVYFICLNRF